MEIQYLEDIKEADFRQAKLAWEKLEEAGLNAGDLVSWGLSFGHGYEVKGLNLPQQAFREIKDLLGESYFSEELIVGYNFQRRLLPSGEETWALVPLNQLTSKLDDDLIIKAGDMEEGIIKMTAVFKQLPGKSFQISDILAEKDLISERGYNSQDDR